MSQVLMDAVRSNDVDVLRQVVAEDPSLVNYRDEDGNSAVLTAIYHGAHDAAGLLVAQGAQLTVHEAAAAGDAARVRAALDADPDLINSLSPDGWTPLHLAAFFGHEDVARLLLERGADVHAVSTNRMQNMPIHAAAANGQARLVALLLDHGTEVNVRSRDWSPLHLAVENGDEGLVQLLLLRGADADAPMPDGQLPLARAQQHGHHEIAALLAGAASAQ